MVGSLDLAAQMARESAIYPPVGWVLVAAGVIGFVQIISGKPERWMESNLEKDAPRSLFTLLFVGLGIAVMVGGIAVLVRNEAVTVGAAAVGAFLILLWNLLSFPYRKKGGSAGHQVKREGRGF